jgi:hypothetical protein
MNDFILNSTHNASWWSINDPNYDLYNTFLQDIQEEKGIFNYNESSDGIAGQVLAFQIKLMSLDEFDTLYMRLPTQLYPRERTAEVKTVVKTLKMVP